MAYAGQLSLRCAPGYYLIAAAADPRCMQCQAGFWCAGADAPKTKCGAGQSTPALGAVQREDCTSPVEREVASSDYSSLQVLQQQL